mmetsp:Transcript_3887/g.7769  ORF Transcript_3887/g.7769 Transcript_3887/m.7769 type:complete len:109 (-) Transcript_3887:142-468(-)
MQNTKCRVAPTLFGAGVFVEAENYRRRRSSARWAAERSVHVEGKWKTPMQRRLSWRNCTAGTEWMRSTTSPDDDAVLYVSFLLDELQERDAVQFLYQQFMCVFFSRPC